MVTPNDSPGVPLAHYRQHGADVLLTCIDCIDHRVLPLEALIDRLRARGLGDETTGVKTVAGFVTAPCGRCGGARFESRPNFAEIARGGTSLCRDSSGTAAVGVQRGLDVVLKQG